jgi:tRNA modification GTPase
VAVVRISGLGARAALESLGGPAPPPRRATLRTLRWQSETLDRALVLFFPGPASVTGEDVVELHLHGGRAIVAAMRGALAAMPGLREAAPGEFTRRAFEHGRIDLAEAEGLADLVEAETEAQRRAALALAGGALSRQTEVWRGRLLALAAQVEAALDFADEADVADPLTGFGSSLAALRGEMADWLARPPAERLKDGVRVVIAGPPNAGKSSLFNALIGREAAIVTPTAGTTRDLIEAPVAIGGTAFVLIDTAGLRETRDAIEAIGVDRARGSAEMADILLWLGTSEQRPEGAVLVHAKADIVPKGPGADLAVSALTGQGLDELVDLLRERASQLVVPEGEVALNARHRQALTEAVGALREAEVADPLIAAEALRLARVALDRITGRAGVEDMLDALFGRFCIGK